MENASKALIIAGAILLSIAIIGLGMGALNGVSGIITDANMDEQEVASFNQKFLPYEGKQKGNKVLVLIDAVNANNRANSDDSSKCVTIVGPSIEAQNIAGAGDEEAKTYTDGTIKTGKNYTVTFDYDTSGTGLINKITITAIGGGASS